MQARAQEVADNDTKLLGALTAVANTGPSLGKNAAYASPPPEPDDAEKPAKTGKRPAPRPASAAPRAAGPSPSHAAAPPKSTPSPAPEAKPAAKPAPKRDDDGPAAPKPTQGSAPAEIEP